MAPRRPAARRLRRLSSHLLAPTPTSVQGSSGGGGGGGGEEATPAAFAEIAEGIERDLAAHSVPSLAVAVARGGEVLWEQGFGFADREARRPSTTHTAYSLASISKPITATGLAILVERGLVDLDAPLDSYLGAAKLNPGAAGDSADGATVRRVANHTSGLPLHYHFFYEDEPYPRPPFEETILRYGSLVTPPGEHYQYSNLGFGVLDHVIARASGRSYIDFMRQEVFVPLGLTRTSVDIAPGLEPHTAVRYDTDGSRIPFYTFDHPGGSAVWSSAHDLVRFGMYHLHDELPTQRRILTKGMVDEMHEDTTGDAHPDGGYGIGWAVVEATTTPPPSSAWKNWRPRIVSHTGGMGGVATALLTLPGEDIAVVALCNAGSQLPHCVAERILATLLPDAGLSPTPMPEPPAPGGDEAKPLPVSVHAPNPGAGGDTAPSFTPKPAWLAGDWQGVVGEGRAMRDWEPLLLSLSADAEGRVHLRLGSEPWTLLDSAAVDGDGWLRGVFRGDVGTVDANRRAYNLHLEVKLRGDVLCGSLVAMTGMRPGESRAGNALTEYVALRKL